MAPELKEAVEETPPEEPQAPPKSSGLGSKLLAVMEEVMFTMNQVPAQVKPALVNPELRQVAGEILDQVGIPIGNPGNLSPRGKMLLFAGTLMGYGALVFLNARQFKKALKEAQVTQIRMVPQKPRQPPREEVKQEAHATNTDTDSGDRPPGGEGEAGG